MVLTQLMLLSILYIIGITAEAMTGAIAAGKRNMDWFGVMLVASATAIGGGSVRDILLGHYPLGWVAHPQYLVITCLAGLLTTVMAKWVVRFHKLFIILDAIGLIVFSIIGCRVAMNMGLPAIICVVAAVVTGVFGGMLRDLICRRQPMVLHKELYASVSLIAGVIYWAMLHFGIDQDLTIIVTLVVGFTMRMAAVQYSWSLPVFSFEDESERVASSE
ncbi:hypothetical protein EQ875_03775 [Photobacterium damselae subsp. damselae]|nr:hypothetical protein EQ875_03775 [Photobacterium damselae subsp. damselae]